jgi:Planctomycete cytochrome C
MRIGNTIRLLGMTAALAFGWLTFDEPSSAGSSRQTPVDFERDIRPLLHARCVECHGANKQQSGLRLDRKAGAMNLLR